MKSNGITIKELAQLLGVSSTTISRVLSGSARKYRISEKTEKRVQEAVNQHNFQPNQIAQNLRLRRTNTIGLVIPDISNPFFAQLARQLDIELRQHGKLILLCDSQDQVDLEEEQIELLTNRKVDGLLVAPVGQQSDHLKRITIPMVMIDRYFDDLEVPYIATNNHLGAYQATQMLIDNGHRRIACLQGLPDTVSNRERVGGFEAALMENNIQPEAASIEGYDFSEKCGFDAMNKILHSSSPLPTAVLALSNLIAIGAMRAIQNQGYVIPEDISIISFDEQPYFELTSPPLTTVQQPINQIGKRAVEMLMERLQAQHCPSELLKPTIVERKSIKSITT